MKKRQTDDDQIRVALKKLNHPNQRRHRRAVRNREWWGRTEYRQMNEVIEKEGKAIISNLKKIFRRAALSKVKGASLDWSHGTGMQVDNQSGAIYIFMHYTCHYVGIHIDRQFVPSGIEDIYVEAWRLFGMLQTWWEPEKN